jgi:hypothetical protein
MKLQIYKDNRKKKYTRKNKKGGIPKLVKQIGSETGKLPLGALRIGNSVLDVGDIAVKTVGSLVHLGKSTLGVGISAAKLSSHLLDTTGHSAADVGSSGLKLSSYILDTTGRSGANVGTSALDFTSNAIKHSEPLTQESLSTATNGINMLNQILKNTASPVAGTVGDSMKLVHGAVKVIAESSVTIAQDFLVGLTSLIVYPAKAVVRALSERNSRKIAEMEIRMKDIARNNELSNIQKEAALAKEQLELLKLQKELELAKSVQITQEATANKVDNNPVLQKEVKDVITEAKDNVVEEVEQRIQAAGKKTKRRNRRQSKRYRK